MLLGTRFVAITMAFLIAVAYSPLHAAGPNAASAFVGRWDLTLKSPGKDLPSWIAISDDGGQLKAQMVGRWGSARALPKVDVSGNTITFVSPKEEEGSTGDMVFHGELKEKRLVGAVNAPNGGTWRWMGERSPALTRTRTPHWGKPVPLFDGQDLNGWRLDQPGAPEWTVKDGAIVKPSHAHELVNDRRFQDFKLHIGFNCGKDANSGVYLRGRYEVQIESESEAEPASHHTGGVYGFLAPNPELPRRADVWQTYDITLIGRRLTVVQNGTTLINDQEIPGITGGALDSNEATPGPIYLQGSEKGQVLFRNIIVTPAL